MTEDVKRVIELMKKYGDSVNPRAYVYFSLSPSRIYNNPYYSKNLLEDLEPEKDRRKDKKIIDQGCGPGCDSRSMINDGFSAIGIDLSEPTINLGFDYYGDRKSLGKHFVVGDVCKTLFDDGDFDYAHSGNLIHRLDYKKIDEYFNETSRILKPKGGLIGRCLYGKRRDDVIYLINDKELRDLLTNYGFKDIRIDKKDFPVPSQDPRIEKLVEEIAKNGEPDLAQWLYKETLPGYLKDLKGKMSFYAERG